MGIQYDKLNAAYAMPRTLQEEFLKSNLTKEELDAQEFVIKNDIRELLGFPPIPSP